MPKSMYELCGITEDDFREYFMRYKTCGRVAKVLGVSRKTVNAYAKPLGLTMPPSRPRSEGRPKMLEGSGQIVRWARAHPEEKLPTKAVEIAKLTGCSRGAAYSFLRWRHHRWLQYLGKFPQIPETTKLTDTEGRTVDFRFVKSYTLDFDITRMRVIIKARFGKAALTTIRLSIGAFEALFTL